MSIWVKVCGITTLEDARAALDAGVDAIGLNFVPASKRFIEPRAARDLVRQLGQAATTWVGVVADESPERLRELRDEVGLDWLQLHGRETPNDLEQVLPGAFKAVTIGDASDVAFAETFGGDRVLVDARPPRPTSGASESLVLGGSGHTFDWSLVSDFVRRRRTILAGGLNPDNVAEAVTFLAPWGVDVASGVESAPGRKDALAMRRFVERARAAAEPGS